MELLDEIVCLIKAPLPDDVLGACEAESFLFRSRGGAVGLDLGLEIRSFFLIEVANARHDAGTGGGACKSFEQ